MTNDSILNSVRMWEDQWEEGHIAAGPAERFHWHEEQDFPLDKIYGARAIVKGFKRDQKIWAADGDPQYYDDMLKEPIYNPIVVVVIDGKAYPWDGNHRIAASLITGRSTIKAYVGIPSDLYALAVCGASV